MKRHAFDPLSFAFGLIFAVTGAAFVIGGADVFDHRLDRLWPFALIAVGLATIIAGAGWGRAPRTRPDGADAPPAEPDEPETHEEEEEPVSSS
jgi:hypothetical protein